MKIAKLFTNFSSSVSESLLSIFSGNIKSSDLLKKPYIIKSMQIGLSYLNEQNKPTILNQMFKGELLHSSIYLKVEAPAPDNLKAGVLVQYGKYEYIQKDKMKADLQDKVDNIGFPYGKDGGLMFAEIEYAKFKEIFCSAGLIHPRMDNKKGVQMTLKTFIDKVKETNGPWDFKSYDPKTKSCQEFVATALQIINIDYSPDEDKDDLNDNDIPIVIKTELEKHKKY
jgi:hypothetical protein